MTPIPYAFSSAKVAPLILTFYTLGGLATQVSSYNWWSRIWGSRIFSEGLKLLRSVAAWRNTWLDLAIGFCCQAWFLYLQIPSHRVANSSRSFLGRGLKIVWRCSSHVAVSCTPIWSWAYTLERPTHNRLEIKARRKQMPNLLKSSLHTRNTHFPLEFLMNFIFERIKILYYNFYSAIEMEYKRTFYLGNKLVETSS